MKPALASEGQSLEFVFRRLAGQWVVPLRPAVCPDKAQATRQDRRRSDALKKEALDASASTEQEQSQSWKHRSRLDDWCSMPEPKRPTRRQSQRPRPSCLVLTKVESNETAD